MKTDLKLVAKYLGFGNKQPDERTKHDMERIAAQFEQAITGKWTYGHYLLDHSVEGLITLEGTAVVLEGKSITRTLKRCKEVYIMVCTLGVQGDLLIERNKMMSPTLGMIADACASAFVETIADSCQQEIESQLPAGAGWRARHQTECKIQVVRARSHRPRDPEGSVAGLLGRRHLLSADQPGGKNRSCRCRKRRIAGTDS